MMGNVRLTFYFVILMEFQYIWIFKVQAEDPRLHGLTINASNNNVTTMANLTISDQLSVNDSSSPRNQLNSHLQQLLPESWQKMCTAKYTFVSGSNFTSQTAIFVSCDLKESSHWSLYDYRKWISANQEKLYKIIPVTEELRFAFEFKCFYSNATVSLPWPAKARHLWYISVVGCTLTDYITEYNIEYDFPEPLRVVEFVDCVKITENFFDYLRDYGNISRQYYCGMNTLERYVKRNVTDYFPETVGNFVLNENRESLDITPENKNTRTTSSWMQMPSVSNNHQSDEYNQSLEEQMMFDEIAKFTENANKVEHECSPSRLRYIDESCSPDVAVFEKEMMIEKKSYPYLQYYNMSHCRLNQIPSIFLQWRRFFPKMKYLDLSFNRIGSFNTLTDHGFDADGIGVLDLSHNNITTVTLFDIFILSHRSNTVFVDINNNPFVCDCKLVPFVNELRNKSSKAVSNYNYLLDLKCSSPDKYKGKIISKLPQDFCEDLELIFMEAPVAILSVFVLLLILILVLTIKCRKEIMILAFTRLHINLPCRKLAKNEDKNYDAFIAYSEQDGSWVFDTLLPRLEQPKEENGPGLKLCIHHRDFPAGGCIADNITDKVKESHHTVLILSNNFLRSYWCKYEFRAAFAQSLLERKRHLIMIMKEELDKHLTDPDLKRCLKTFTYVKADDRLFWDKLIYALSDHRENNVRKKERQEHHNEAQNNNGEEVDLQGPVNVLQGQVNMVAQANELMNHNNNNNIHYIHGQDNLGFMLDGIWNI